MKEILPNQTGEEGCAHPKLLRRSRVLLIIAVILFALLLFRVLLLQTLEYDRYQQKVIDQMTTEASVNAERGNIYDANGVLLATNVSTYRVFISPSSIADAQVEANKNGEDVRYDELIARGQKASLPTILKEIQQRDYQDTHRPIAPLKMARDSIKVDTSDLSIEEVIAKIKGIIAEKIPL